MEPVAFAITGADIIQGGNINTNSSGGSNGQGEVSFSGGASVFDADDVIIFEVVNATSDGEIGNGSAISDITVFESNDDYQSYLASVEAGTPDTSLIKFNYAPQNPGQTATIQSDISGLGDSYVRLNANIFQPSDGGPTLNNTLTIAPGTNIGSNGGAQVTIDRVRDFDLDFDGSIDPNTTETGNSDFFIGNYIEILNGGPLCFAKGTSIETSIGDVNVENLLVGEYILTLDHGAQQIRWIGRQYFDHRSLETNPKLQPIRVKAGALGTNIPARDLIVSPQHRILVKSEISMRMFDSYEVLVSAKHLLELDGVEIAHDIAEVTYFHLLCDDHEVIRANGTLAETLYLGAEAVKTMSLEAIEEVQAIFGKLGDITRQIARPVPKGAKSRRMVSRHIKNNKDLVQC